MYLLNKIAKIFILSTILFHQSVSYAKEYLNVYNWSEYIAAEDLQAFEEETGIKLRYNLYDSDYILESKLISGKTGYDIVFPSMAPFLIRQIKLGFYQPLIKNKIPNYKNIDSRFLKILAQYDQDNTYAIPWIWSSLGIGYNKNKLEKIFPNGFPQNLNLIFNKKYLEKLKECGVAILDSPSDIIPLILLYDKIDPNSETEEAMNSIENRLRNIKSYVRYFHTSKYIDDLANGEICVAVGYSTDIFQSSAIADELKKETIKYLIPEEGSIISVDTVAILKDAPNRENAYKFLDFILRPEVSARITNKFRYPNTNKASHPFINKDIINNEMIYPNPSIFEKLHPKKELSSEYERKRNRLWMRVISESP
jgi:putrescine transport system substrate-binding protein